ncbi:MAG: YicC/YloC family endoribonuclease [Myxococcota bacterium]
MSIRSMTGYSHASAQADGWSIHVQCKSVNHRSLDTRLHVPRECAWLEQEATSIIRTQMHRGRVELRVDLGFDATSDDVDVNYIDADRFTALCSELRDLAQISATGPVTLGDVLQFRHIFENKTVAEIEEGHGELIEAVREAVDKLIDSREDEGQGIADDLNGHLDFLEGRLSELSELLPKELAHYRGRLRERVTEAVEDFGAGDIEDERLAQELAYYADKADISEEVQRAESHVATLREILAGNRDEEAVGKTIDFYLQELIRETNTMGSKSNSSTGTDLVIDMKSTVEKMREQAANIE